ncbi:hypothetical protein B0H13DRAFT_2301433 [Mycena leptocephala]|nr:hypothetical protein B0H13DRAFT_2301433 [Mycena leptocephala]
MHYIGNLEQSSLRSSSNENPQVRRGHLLLSLTFAALDVPPTGSCCPTPLLRCLNDANDDTWSLVIGRLADFLCSSALALSHYPALTTAPILERTNGAFTSTQAPSAAAEHISDDDGPDDDPLGWESASDDGSDESEPEE